MRQAQNTADQHAGIRPVLESRLNKIANALQIKSNLIFGSDGLTISY